MKIDLKFLADSNLLNNLTRCQQLPRMQVINHSFLVLEQIWLLILCLYANWALKCLWISKKYVGNWSNWHPWTWFLAKTSWSLRRRGEPNLISLLMDAIKAWSFVMMLPMMYKEYINAQMLVVNSNEWLSRWSGGLFLNFCHFGAFVHLSINPKNSNCQIAINHYNIIVTMYDDGASKKS